MSAQLDNIRAAYETLKGRAISALRTQLGDAARLGETWAQVLLFLQVIEQVRFIS
jgi:hypothetical protein